MEKFPEVYYEINRLVVVADPAQLTIFQFIVNWAVSDIALWRLNCCQTLVKVEDET